MTEIAGKPNFTAHMAFIRQILRIYNFHMKKIWYIWLSFLAFTFLFADSSQCIWRYARENKISLLDEQSAWLRFCGHFFGLAIIRFMFPIGVLLTLFHLNESRWGLLGTTSAETIQFICVYFLGVYVTYKHV